VFSYWLLGRSINSWTSLPLIFSKYSLWSLANFLDALHLLPGLRYAFYLHENIQRHFFFGKRKGGVRTNSRNRCLLLHLIHCHPCPAVPSLQMHCCSPGTVCVPCVKVLMHHMKLRFIAQRVDSGVISDESLGRVLGELLV